jgi:succinoglycan biosynthesis protein ExoA
LLLQAVYEQSYPRQELEVIIADGRSTDKTREVIDEFRLAHQDLVIKVVENDKQNIPAGLNRAVEASRGEYILRLDAHSLPYPDYVERCIQALINSKGDNVGGMWEIRPGSDGWIAASIAFAASHPFGIGDARYRLGGKAQYVETVPFGSFHRTLFERIGPFNEELLTNEDYEFNVRIKNSGGKIWFDPTIRTQYFARKTLGELFKQYWRYGYWKGRMIRKYPQTMRLRQFLPPVFVLSLAFLILGSVIFHATIYLLGLEASLYAVFLVIAGVQAYRKYGEIKFLIGVPMAISAMHVAWGSSFLWSMLRR